MHKITKTRIKSRSQARLTSSNHILFNVLGATQSITQYVQVGRTTLTFSSHIPLPKHYKERLVVIAHTGLSLTMRQFASSIALCFLFLFFTTFVLANPISEGSSPNPALRLAKRSACSNGIKTNCGSASVGCSGSQCTVCCGTCCQCFTGRLFVPG